MSHSAGELDRATERDLVAKAQDGDEKALEALLSAHQDRVWRTALGLLGGDRDAAWEVAQEVLVSAWKHIHQFRSESRFSTWLHRMTANFTKNRHVSEGRRRARFVSLEQPPTEGEDDRPRQHAESAPSPRDRAAGSEAMQILRERLGQLSEEFRAVLVMRYMEDMAYEEIAEALELPLGTVKSRINRGRRELRLLMGDILGEGGGT